MAEYPKEQIWKIYEQLPDELKDAIFSEETAENIASICERNGIEDQRVVSEIARITGHVLMGLILPDEFQEMMEKELKLKKELAKKVSFNIHRFVFFPVKDSLSALYQMEIVPPGLIKPEGKALEKKEPREKDVYREGVE